MIRLDPDQALQGRIVVVAPHMDDELIGCGATLASLSRPDRAFVVYATDGSRSPESPLPWRRVDRAALARARREEALEGLEALGVPSTNARFLALPDGRLRRRRSALALELARVLDEIRPQFVLAPFRFDGHPDHLAVSRTVRDLHEAPGGARGADNGRAAEQAWRALEYFVYSRWRLLPGGDVRERLRPECLLALSPGREAMERKRRALELHRTQSTAYFAWQRRPNLTGEFIRRVSGETEAFLDPVRCPGGIWKRSPWWFRVVHAVEPRLKRAKDRLKAAAHG